jgi:hypothetical protein
VAPPSQWVAWRLLELAPLLAAEAVLPREPDLQRAPVVGAPALPPRWRASDQSELAHLQGEARCPRRHHRQQARSQMEEDCEDSPTRHQMVPAKVAASILRSP